MAEVWKEVFHNGKYTGRKVSNTGRLVSDDGRECILSDNGAGYLSFQILNIKREDGTWQGIRKYAHRLVAEYFLDNPSNLPQVNHKDCNKSNNHVDNLEWVSRRDNINHAHAMGRMTKRSENAEMDILEVRQVIDLYVAVRRDGVGISEKARQMGLPRTTASSIMNKRSRSTITDRIDEYLKSDSVVYDRMPTIFELGFNEKSQLVCVREKLVAHNTSGKKGITRSSADGIPYWMAMWLNEDKKYKSKYFNINKFGDEEAFRLACEYREQMIKEMEAA